MPKLGSNTAVACAPCPALSLIIVGAFVGSHKEQCIRLPTVPNGSSPFDPRLQKADHRYAPLLAILRLAEPVLIALPGIEALRRREVEALDATCARGEASLAAAKGDYAPARAYAAACTGYVDLLTLPASKLKGQWNDLVVDLCQASTERNTWAGGLQRQGEGPGSETRRRIAVLTRWNKCAAKPEIVFSNEKQKLLQDLTKRYKATVASCAQ